MDRILHLNLIHFLDFYLIIMFFFGLARRIGQYKNIGKLVVAGPARWPKLLKVVSEHRMIFLTWKTMLPALLALLLSMIQLTASRLVWPEAGKPPDGLTIERILEVWPILILILPLACAVLAVDCYSLYTASNIDRKMLEGYFDQAEYWLASHTATVVRVVTFGFVNPRKMVATEVRKALTDASDLLNFTLWWVSLQVGLRFAFGLSLWLTWAFVLAHSGA